MIPVWHPFFAQTYARPQPTMSSGGTHVPTLPYGAKVVHTEPLPSPRIQADIDKAREQGTSWIRRNLREWPFGKKLACYLDDGRLAFVFEQI